MLQRISLAFLFCFFLASAVLCPYAYSTKASDIALALDVSDDAGIAFYDSSGWSKKTGEVYDGNVPTTNNTYLEASSPTKAYPQGMKTFNLTVKGAGILYFDFHDSLDYSNDSYLCAYEGNLNDGLLDTFACNWLEEWVTYDGWWGHGKLELGTDTYIHTVTFAIVGPLLTVEEPDPEIKNMAWLDNFRWVPDMTPEILAFFPDPTTDNYFNDSVTVSLESFYDNLEFRYTTNGSVPTTNSTPYNPDMGITITDTTTIKAIAVENGQKINDSVYEATYSKRSATDMPAPTFRVPRQEDMINFATLEISSEIVGASIYYTYSVVGHDPIRLPDGTPGTNTFLYSDSKKVTLDRTSIVKAFAWKQGMTVSPIREWLFIKLPLPQISYSLNINLPYTNFGNINELTLNKPVLEDSTTIKYQINGGEILNFEDKIDLKIDQNTKIRFQAQQWDRIYSDVLSQTFEKLPVPEISFSGNNTPSTHPYFDEKDHGTTTLTATQGAIIIFQKNEGDIQVYDENKNPLIIDVLTTKIRFQTQQAGKLHSDIREFYRADTEFTLPAPEAPGWSLFFLPGEISEQTSADLIEQWQPIAYDNQKKTYFRPDLLRGGNSYWVFTPEGSTRSDTSFFIFPLEGITVPSKTWLLTGIPQGASLPEDIHVHSWNGKTFQPLSQRLPGTAAWLYKP